MNILSLFDGISCGQVALQRAGISYENYWASEIDKFAQQVTQHHFPNTIQLGDVHSINAYELPQIDLIMGGSPCQSVSRAGDGSGFEGASGLFSEFMRIMHNEQPKYFLLENVMMKKSWQDIITIRLGVEPIEINSALVSGQRRKRLYWTNIPIQGLPENKNILLKDILESDVDSKYSLSQKGIDYMNREYCGARRWNKYPNDINGKSQTICSVTYKGVPYGVIVNCPQVPSFADKVYSEGYTGPPHSIIRRLTPLECERLQTLPDNYTSILSNTQRYKSIGNGWTVDIIAHILKNIL